MKRLLATATAFLFLLLLPCPVAVGEETDWIRITEKDVPLYTNAARTKVTCNLEWSYYLKVLSRQGEFLRVELMDNTENFPKIVGYVLASQAETCDQPPVAPLYPQVRVSVSENNAKLHFSPIASSDVLYAVTNTQTLSYYGSVTSEDKLWYYVYWNDIFGYVEASKVTAPAISPHPTPLTQPTVAPTTDDPPPEDTPYVADTGTSAGEILLIAFVVLLSVGLVTALFLPRNDGGKSEKR